MKRPKKKRMSHSCSAVGRQRQILRERGRISIPTFRPQDSGLLFLYLGFEEALWALISPLLLCQFLCESVTYLGFSVLHMSENSTQTCLSKQESIDSCNGNFGDKACSRSGLKGLLGMLTRPDTASFLLHSHLLHSQAPPELVYIPEVCELTGDSVGVSAQKPHYEPIASP